MSDMRFVPMQRSSLLRRRLLLAFAIPVAVSVCLVGWRLKTAASHTAGIWQSVSLNWLFLVSFVLLESSLSFRLRLTGTIWPEA